MECKVEGKKYEGVNAEEYLRGEGITLDLTEDDLANLSPEVRAEFLNAQASLKTLAAGSVIVDMRKPLT